MGKILKLDHFYWLSGGAIGGAAIASVDLAALTEIGRWSFFWLVEPFTRLLYFGAFCG